MDAACAGIVIANLTQSVDLHHQMVLDHLYDVPRWENQPALEQEREEIHRSQRKFSVPSKRPSVEVG